MDRLTQRVGTKAIPVLRFLQESLLEWSTSFLTLRPFHFQGPTIVNRKVLHQGDPGAEAHLSQTP